MKAEQAIFLDNTLELLRDFFSVPENKNKRFWPDGFQIKQLDLSDSETKEYSSIIGRLYIPGYWVIVDYNDQDLLVFSNEKAIKDFIKNMNPDYMMRHDHFIDRDGNVIKILPEVRVIFEPESKTDGIAR